MIAWPGPAAGRAGEGRARDGRHLAWALGISALLHAAVLTWWPHAARDWQAAGVQVLTVSLRPAAQAPQPAAIEATGGAPAAARAQAMLLAPQATLAVPAAPAPATAGLGQTAARAAPPPLVSTRPQPLRAAVPAPGVDQTVSNRNGGVSVLLMIGEGGRVGQILWNQLPALTDEQLRRIEAAIRARSYAGALAGQAVNEVIDVRTLLDAPPARDQ